MHGLDLAAALSRDPWLTREAGDVVEELLLGATGAQVRDALGWDQLTMIRKATGREPVSQAEADELARLDVQWLAFGIEFGYDRSSRA
ncbi:MAG: hypothetical protein GEU94_00730 [Micromonosporaceae bacterium]|nr:hypothetical protein [Micromonosporaceae bacterium]